MCIHVHILPSEVQGQVLRRQIFGELPCWFGVTCCSLIEGSLEPPRFAVASALASCPTGPPAPKRDGCFKSTMLVLFCFVLLSLKLSVCPQRHDYRIQQRPSNPQLNFFVVVMAYPLAICWGRDPLY